MSKKVEQARADFLNYALTLPEAWEDHPWGDSVVKVRKKIFIFFGLGSVDDKKFKTLSFCVKLPGSCSEALRREDAQPMGYGLGRSGWVRFDITAKNMPTQAVLREWLEESYQAVAPKKLARLLEPD